MDRIGHRRLQLIGFVMMAVCFGFIGVVPGIATAVVPFLAFYGVSYFFTEFGPNVTTFVLPGELFPVSVRATGHGISAGIGKLGAFTGVFSLPLAAVIASAARHTDADRGGSGARGTADARPARARWPQPGGNSGYVRDRYRC
jgi:nitrate/nitrite transporter NarK